MPLSLAERVRERRNQRLADSQRRRALVEANNPAAESSSTPFNGGGNSNNPLALGEVLREFDYQRAIG